MRVAPPVELSAEQQTTLEARANGRQTEVRVADRARVILLAADGKQNLEIAETLFISAPKAARWRWRFLAKDLPGSEKDAPRPGRLPFIDSQKVA
jgi:Homeodomain-like domain